MVQKALYTQAWSIRSYMIIYGIQQLA